MKVAIFRFTLVFLAIAFLLLISGSLFTQTPLPLANLFPYPNASPTTNASPTPTVTALTSPKPTATTEPSASEKFVSTLSNVQKDLVSPIQAIVNLIAVLIIICLGIFLLWRIIRLTRKSTLIVETITNSTDHDDLNKMLPGLTQLAREKLIKELEGVSDDIKRYKHLGPKKYRPPKKTEVPQGASDDKLSSLLKSLQDATEGELKTAIQVVNLMFPPRGTKLTITLQSKGDTLEKLGVSLEVTDLRSQQEPALYTIWEESKLLSKVKSHSQSNSSRISSRSQPTAAQTPPTFPQAPTTNSHVELHVIEMILSLFTRKNASPSASSQREENMEAMASYSLATIYEEHGALDQAKNYYEETLKKQPTNTETKEALKHILKTKKALEERYDQLLTPATHWLAIELARRSMASYERQILLEKNRNIYRATVYNFIGELHLSAASEKYPVFYQLAISDFNKAMILYKEWYQPYENLAGTYSLMGVNKEKEQNIKYQEQSVSFYKKALKRTHRLLERKDSKWVRMLYWYDNLMFSLHLQFLSSKLSKWIHDERRIILGKAIAQYLTEENDATDEAKRAMKQYFEDKKSSWNWDATKELDSALLYDLAYWYTKAYQKNETDAHAKQMARRYLLYSLARDIARKDSAKEDVEIKAIVDGDGLKDLITKLEENLEELPNLSTSTGIAFSQPIEEILTNWSREKEAKQT